MQKFLKIFPITSSVDTCPEIIQEFRKCIGVSEKRVAEILIQFTTQYSLTEQLVEASLLLPDTKKTYLAEYRQRRDRFKDMK